MKAPMAKSEGAPILCSSCGKRLGLKRASIQPLYRWKSNSGCPTRKVEGPKPTKGVSQVEVPSRLASNDATSGDRGATMPQP